MTYVPEPHVDKHWWGPWERAPEWDTTLHAFIATCTCGKEIKKWEFSWAEEEREHQRQLMEERYARNQARRRGVSRDRSWDSELRDLADLQ